MNATFGDVTVAIGDRRVAEVELHRPPANYFDAALLGGVVDAIAWAEAQGSRAVVLCSEGRHFCAGLDFGRPTAAEPEALHGLYQRAEALVSGPLPVVVAIQGAAIGGGLGLALVGDFRVGSPDSRFAANFARLGFHQGFGISTTLPRAVGPQMALELLVTGRRIDGTEALRIGLVRPTGRRPTGRRPRTGGRDRRVGTAGRAGHSGHPAAGSARGVRRRRAGRGGRADGAHGDPRLRRRGGGVTRAAAAPLHRSVAATVGGGRGAVGRSLRRRPGRRPARPGWPH